VLTHVRGWLWPRIGHAEHARAGTVLARQGWHARNHLGDRFSARPHESEGAAPDREGRHQMRDELAADLHLAAKKLAEH
jgi:hypothetical protein